ncbi:DUF6161 domain-containing protein [Flavobacterium sp. HJJ]|uniref:DUF6161 domain-containing protein n=1 Tax=Flavobacterium sp. HJJ TaxID=2783792 RepID=UPI00188CCA97|nr:DUF6161 domain-containing protein [Flavobacterium sp. HJJ]MBF4472613.1 hypothetical protein [Flavobacterium sp. HJJ]
MTKAELNSKIAESINFEWFKTPQEIFNFHYVNNTLTYTGVSAIYEFVNQQVNGWEGIEQDLPNEFIQSKQYFKSIQSSIVQVVQNYSELDVNQLNAQWSTVKNAITQVHTYPITYDSPITSYLLDLYTSNRDYFQGAYNFIFGIRYDVNSKDLFFGAVLAYEFTLKDKTEITGRKKQEQLSISRLKNDFKKYIEKSENEVVNYIEKTHNSYNEYVKKIDDLKVEKETEFSEWFTNTKTEEWEKWYNEKIQALKRLEDTYEANLKLEKPAKYWQIKSTKYYEQGNTAKTILFWVIGASVIFLGIILVVSPSWIFESVFKGNSITIVRWSIVFITLISLIAFSVKALTKYMFSSYHLARDAEERHTLTFFYLSLLKDTEVKDEDRNLILQSLFSRVETGLLKDDSSPTMPSETISKIFTKN